ARLAAFFLLLGFASHAHSQTPPSYARQVKPFLAKYCLECHNSQEVKGELDLETFAGAMKGGKNGPVIVAGKPDQSRLVLAVEGKIKPAMPPKKAKQPPAGEIPILRDWIAAGAKDDIILIKRSLPPIAPRSAAPAPITALAYTPDGKVLFAARHKDVVRIEGSNIQTLATLSSPVTALAIRPNGKLLAVASSTTGAAGEVSFFAIGSAPGSKPARTLASHADVILDIAFSPDGRILATTGYDRLIKLWDVDTCRLLRTLKDHSDAVYSLAFDPTGQLLASAGADRAVKVWNVQTGVRLYTLSDSTDWVYAVAWRPDGKQLAAGGVDKSIRTWDVSSAGGKLAHSVFAHEGPISRLRYTADSHTLYSLGDDRILKAWDATQLVERHVYPAQPDLALTFVLRLDGKQAALGRFDGAVVVLDTADGKVVAQPLPVKPKPPVLTKLTPNASPRGQTVQIILSGEQVEDAAEIVAEEPGLTIHKPSVKNMKSVTVLVAIPATARLGSYKLRAKNAAGTSAPVEFFVDCFKAIPYTAPTQAGLAPPLMLPVTVTGTLGEAGDVDRHALSLAAMQQVGVQLVSTKAKLDAILRIVDRQGKVLAESNNGVLGFTAPHTSQSRETYVLEIHDRDYRGNKEMAYRLHIGDIPVITSLFPLGMQRGTEATIQVQGVHLGSFTSATVRVPADQQLDSRVSLPLPAGMEPPLGTTSVLVGDYPEVSALQGSARTVEVPGVANGVIEKTDGRQSLRFSGRKNQRLILEVNARRLGSPLDSYLEISDIFGKPVPRAVLRSVGMTYIAFRDHDSASQGIRLETWNNLGIDDYLWAGNELMRIQALPRGPDDDCQFYSVGGKRLGFLDTTPTFHSQGTPMYQVQIHPPGKTFPANGYPSVQLGYRNDDGGPGYGKDSRIIFDPPADAGYLVSVGDASGTGGPNSAYRLTIRPAEPRFTVDFSPATPNVWKGGGASIAVTATRLDGYDGPIRVRFTGLPPGFHSPETIISAGQIATAMTLSADANAPPPDMKSKLELTAEAMIQGHLVQSVKIGGVPKLLELGDLTASTVEPQVALKPGDQVWVTAKIDRRNGFKGRVPLDVRGLPHGVRVLDVGLNGIMITELETTRRFALYAEPWVEAMTLPIVVVARNEKKGTEIATKPVVLQVLKAE
ncbi:MAG TPA: c-type cytochrome domain-containing protein, partial [Gemmataceae bacterium]|nr:c-type cytochrome domain-containing protein [Gemmataceae bacterium]